jgi:hypothetical protein
VASRTAFGPTYSQEIVLSISLDFLECGVLTCVGVHKVVKPPMGEGEVEEQGAEIRKRDANSEQRAEKAQKLKITGTKPNYY